MDVGRFLLYTLGLVIVIAALWWLAGMLGVFEVVPAAVVIAVLVLIVGLGIMGAAFATRGHAEPRHHHPDERY